MQIGQLVEVIDKIDPDVTTMCTIRLIEQDEDGMVWMYLRANDESLNTKEDPRIPGGYYDIYNVDEAVHKAALGIEVTGGAVMI